LHEWAGALIRAGREAEGVRLPGVDAASAYACAQRVLHQRGHYPAAARWGRAAVAARPTAQTAYDTACASAKAGHLDDAMEMLEKARELGFADTAHAAADNDLEFLRGTPRFEAWLASVQERATR
jgi:hypothetical protein